MKLVAIALLLTTLGLGAFAAHVAIERMQAAVATHAARAA